ncbi:MAG: hypothetical protein ABIG92_00475 [Candidatus Omnitrophota bacterium]
MKEEDQKQRIKDIKEISIAIDTWDDIFSDFDPRPMNERALSEDFKSEIAKRYRETRKGDFLVTIFAPNSLNDGKSEKIVIQRLKRHFKHKAMQSKKEIYGIRIRGVFFVITGIMFLGFLTLATYRKLFRDFTIDMLGIILLPLGWFGVWEGFSKIVDTSISFIQDQTLYDKLSKANYRFKYIEDAPKKDAV